MAAPDFSNDEIRFERLGRMGLVTLDRPQALNALTQGMCRALEHQLEAWERDYRVAHVAIRGAGERAFSAGGDIRLIHDMGKAGDPGLLDFFRDEYRLDAVIKRYPKPYTALIDGIAMGGGVGVSVNGRYRVGTDHMLFAMPEVGIGHFPDVGATFFLPRCPGRIGVYAGLTGARLKQADAYYAGIVTHTVPRADLAALVDALAEAEDPLPVLAARHRDPGAAPIAASRSAIDRLFAADDAAAILAALETEVAAGGAGPDAAFARAAAETLRRMSPTSLAIAARQFALGPGLDFDAAMRIEFRIVSHLMRGHDFYEGVRAVILDKDNRPVWRPATIEALDPAEIERHFAPPPGGDLDLGARGDGRMNGDG
jgi:enoyl-CoA hydratase